MLVLAVLVLFGFAEGYWGATGPSAGWTAAAMSADSSKMVAVSSNAGIAISSDGGASWGLVDGSAGLQWHDAAMSTDGSKIAVCVSNFGDSNQYWRSSDGGSTWTKENLTDACAGIATSADGNTMAIARPAP